MAQTHDELVTRIKPATSSVDGTMIKDNTATSKDWPTTGLDYAETRFSKLKQINSDIQI
jgi:quinohemoprotein ethanol dehydrogenase